MKNKSQKKFLLKLGILLISLILISKIFSLVLSKYETVTNSNADIDVAFYLIKEDYKLMTLNLGSILPQNQEYVYTFSIGNKDQEKVAEVDLSYELKIRTTTNLPLNYKLYRNQKYDNPNSVNIITSNEIIPDENGTIFRNIKTDKVTLKYTNPQTDVYYLVVQFPENYNTEKYQNVIEMIEISVDARQEIN